MAKLKKIANIEVHSISFYQRIQRGVAVIIFAMALFLCSATDYAKELYPATPFVDGETAYNERENVRLLSNERIQEIERMNYIQSFNEEMKPIMEKQIRELKREEARKRLLEKIKKQKQAAAKKARCKYYSIYVEDEWKVMDRSWQDYLIKRCKEEGIEKFIPYLIIQLWCESGWDPNTFGYNTNGTYDSGIACINSCNIETVLKNVPGSGDLMDPYYAIDCMIYFMADNFKDPDLTTDQALSKYNTGQPYYNTAYARKIQGIYNGGAGVKMVE